MITSLTISAAAIAFAVNVVSSLMKTFIYPRFGKLGVQIFAFILASVGSWFFIYGQHIASLATFATSALAIFSLSVTFYEVILSRLDVFKVKTAPVEVARAKARANTI